MSAAVRAEEVLKRIRYHECLARGVEVGIFAGQMSAELLSRPNIFLYMVDNYRSQEDQPKAYAESGDFHATTLGRKQQDAYIKFAEQATAFAKDRRQIMLMDSVLAAQQFADGSLDFVFIDADHSYEGCHADIEAWRAKVKPDGVLGGHDYENPDCPKFGVTRAVDGAVEKYGWKLDLGENYTWFVNLQEVP